MTEPGVDTILDTMGPLHGTLSLTGYDLPEGLTYDEWASEAPILATMARASMFWLGDHLRYGEFRWGDKCAQAVEATGLAVRTLLNAQWVCSRIPPTERRPDLTFSHHRAVAALDPEPRRQLLARAADEHMTEGELLGRVRQMKTDTAEPIGDAPPLPPTLVEIVEEVIVWLDDALASESWADVRLARTRLAEAVNGG